MASDPGPLVHVVAFRHGETTLNAAGRLTGQLDPELTARGREQARALAEAVRGPFDRRIHSGLKRAEETLRIALGDGGGDGKDGAAEVDPRWRERSFGTLEGQPKDAWTQPPDLDVAPPGGESYRDLGRRVLAALDDLAAEARAAGQSRRVLVSTHSGVLRWLTALADAPTGHDRHRDPDPDPVAFTTRPGAANGAVVHLAYAAPSTSRPSSPLPSP